MSSRQSIPRSGPRLGPEPWKTIRGVTLTTWDLWLLVLAVTGDNIGLDGVAKNLRERSRTLSGSAQDDFEAKLSQLDDLRLRLTRLDLEPHDIVLKEAKNKVTVARAKRKLFDQNAPAKDYTAAMKETPRRRLIRMASRGYWPKFPVSPEKYANDLLAIVDQVDGYGGESQGSQLASDLDDRWEKLSKTAERSPKNAVALHRAMLLACLTAQERADDSSGDIGGVFSSAIKKYAVVPWEKAGMEREVFIRDAVEFATWEDYGQSDELEAIFQKLDKKHGDLAVRIFDETVAELETHRVFEYQVREALGLKAALLIGHRRFDEFVPLATKLGSAIWMPIVTMAEAAMNAKKPDLALAVFGAANQPGMQREYLAELCLKLTKKKMPTAGLRLVK
jgi:hypothetical protein